MTLPHLAIDGGVFVTLQCVFSVYSKTWFNADKHEQTPERTTMNEAMSTIEIEQNETVVTEISPLGFGSGSISYEAQRTSGELSAEVDARAAEIILSGDMMHEVTDQDDGCIDGRPAVEVLFINANDEFTTRPIDNSAEHERAKVAGGGYITALAMKRALDLPSGHIDDDIRETALILAQDGVYCGAHTGAHSHEDATDCGANDKIDRILSNGVLYRKEINDVTRSLIEVAGLEYHESTLTDKVFEGWSQTVAKREYFDGSTGASRFGAIEDSIRTVQEASGDFTKPLAVSKHLAGDHKEDYIVINYQEGKTFSQAAFHEVLAGEFPNHEDKKLAQAFVVDVPRIVRLAKALTRDRSEDFETALYAGVAYQLATAATLTDGTLRTFVVK